MLFLLNSLFITDLLHNAIYFPNHSSNKDQSNQMFLYSPFYMQACHRGLHIPISQAHLFGATYSTVYVNGEGKLCQNIC